LIFDIIKTMKTKLIIAFCSLLFLFAFTGCSSQSNNKKTTEAPVQEELSDIDPLLVKSGFVRLQLTDPVLYDYNEKIGSGIQQSGGKDINSDNQKRIGLIANFRKNSKYNISGMAQIISQDKIEVKGFSYNGGCGPLILGLTNSSNETKIIAKVKEISSPVSDIGISISIPSNIELIRFDSIAAYCPTSENPVSVAVFQ